MLKRVHRYFISAPVNLKVFKIGYFALFGIGIILFFWFFYFSLSTIRIPFPIEYREGTAQVMTHILLMGGNPFSLEYQPLAMNNYGFGYYLVGLPFAKLFGNSLLVHRLVNFFFLLACLCLIMKTLWQQKKDMLTASLGGLLIVVALSGRGGLGAFPSTMGTFLFLATIIIPFIYSFRTSSLIASAVLALMAYYTKPYFVMGFGIVAAYLFIFVSKRKGVTYTFLFLLVFSVLLAGVRYAFDLYFINTFVSNLSNVILSSVHLQRQLMGMYREFYPTLLLAGLLLFLNLPLFSRSTVIPKTFPFKVNLSEWNAPLLSVPFNYFAFTFITCFLIFVYVLGLHSGSYMTYVYQTLMPPFILWVLQALNSKSRLSIVAFSLMLSNVLLLETILLDPDFLHQRQSSAWKKLYDSVDTLQQVANSPVMASALVERGILPVDAGQTEYYFHIKPYSENRLIGPSYETIAHHGAAYLSALQSDVENHKFDGILVTRGSMNLIPLDVIGQYYAPVDLITIEMPQTHETWSIEIWEPADQTDVQFD